MANFIVVAGNKKAHAQINPQDILANMPEDVKIFPLASYKLTKDTHDKMGNRYFIFSVNSGQKGIQHAVKYDCKTEKYIFGTSKGLRV